MCIEDARSWIDRAERITALTGAGISAESGVPTFRGAGGLWKQFRPEDLATAAAFHRNPELVWEWYDWRRALVAQANPNPGHLALAALEHRVPRFTLITQNVDGLHQRAGSQMVLPLHGSLWTLRCIDCERSWDDSSVPLPSLPRCACGGLARPGVVWFGEPLPEDIWLRAQLAANNCDVLIVIGTSALVYPAAGLVSLARHSGAKVIEVNTEPTALSSVVDCSLQGPAGELLPALIS